MKIGGWRTPSMFERYDIVDHSEMEDAMLKLSQHRASVHSTVHSEANQPRQVNEPTVQVPEVQ